MIWNRVYAPFLAIILVLPFFLCSCSKANGKDDSLFVAEGRKTTLGYGEETLYYGMVNGDTLNVCIEVMDFNRFDYVDLSLKELQCATCSSDTSYFTRQAKTKYLKSTYKQQMQMLEILLNKHPGSLRQKRIRCIDVPLLTSGALNVEISKAMKGTDIVTAVSRSSLIKNLNEIVGKHGYTISGKPYIEKYVLVDENSFRKANNVDSIVSMQYAVSFVDSRVSFSLEQNKHSVAGGEHDEKYGK